MGMCGADQSFLDTNRQTKHYLAMDLQRIDVTEALEPLVDAIIRDGTVLLTRDGEPLMELKGAPAVKTARPDLLTREWLDQSKAWRASVGIPEGLDMVATLRAMRDEED
jgi:hypothetical protein